jgi:hypothetical protein
VDGDEVDHVLDDVDVPRLPRGVVHRAFLDKLLRCARKVVGPLGEVRVREQDVVHLRAPSTSHSAILTKKERLTSERSTLTLPRRLERFIWYLSAGDGGAWAAATVLGGGIFHVYFSATPRGCFVSKLIFISAGTINLAAYGASAKGMWLRKSNTREVRVALAWLEVGRQLAKEQL